MSKVDFGSYKRIVQAFWDPEPKNDDASASSIWCLGREYAARSIQNDVKKESSPQETASPPTTNGENESQSLEKANSVQPNGVTMIGHEAQLQSEEVDPAWPSEFLDDCEARAWFTYRSSFSPIKKSSEASMTLSVRLRSLGDQGGFTSDTGWGCMIRSGQSLLANALGTLRLGRGMLVSGCTTVLC